MLKLLKQQTRQFAKTAISHSKTVSAACTPQNVIAVEKALEGWEAKLRIAGVGDINFNLKCIVAHVLKTKFNALPSYDHLKFNSTQLHDFQRLCEARCARMPLQHILGEWDFMDITLKTAPTVFIPRPETEEFVHKVIEVYRNKPSINMLEVGCGSGAMSLAILNALPQVCAQAIERSSLATTLACENAKMLGLQDRFQVYNHTMEECNYVPEPLKGKTFDLIISNPPYVKTEEFQHLQPEVVVYENLNALDGGPDGLRVARLVFDLACEHLRPGGKLWLELGAEHPPIVKTIMNLRYQDRLRYEAGYEDQYKRERFVEIEKI